MEEDYKLFQLIRRNPINNCVDLSKNMIGKRSGFIYFTENFRIDFENKMANQARLQEENERLQKENEELKNNTRKNEQNSLEFDVDGDWAELKKILNKSRKTNEYIMYNGEKWIKEKYCIPIQKVKDIIKKLNIDIERNKRRKIQHNEDGSLQMEMIAYDPAIIKMRLLKLLESEETNDKNNKKG